MEPGHEGEGGDRSSDSSDGVALLLRRRRSCFHLVVPAHVSTFTSQPILSSIKSIFLPPPSVFLSTFLQTLRYLRFAFCYLGGLVRAVPSESRILSQSELCLDLSRSLALNLRLRSIHCPPLLSGFPSQISQRFPVSSLFCVAPHVFTRRLTSETGSLHWKSKTASNPKQVASNS